MVDENVPPVVAIVTTHNPGPWFEDCLVSLAEQDYPGFTALVVDVGSDEDISARVAAVTPNFFVLRVNDAVGYSAGVNRGAKAVEGAPFYLICHDDVILEPDATRKLVAEAIRQNAAIVGPKLVTIEDRQRLLHVGLDVDKFGAPVRRVTFGELDQAQYDETHETFAIPGACKLVRSDLFATLNGLDEKMTMFGEDIDFSWRAHLAGARVIVVPEARVAHREATASKQKPLPQARSLQWRHEFRSVLKNYSSLKLPFVLIQFFILSAAEVLFFLAAGRRQRVKHVISGWLWNLSDLTELRGARKKVASYRVKSDREIAQFFTGSGTRAKRFISESLEKLHIQAVEERSSIRQRLYEQKVGATLRRRDFILPLALTVIIVLLGSRSFLVGNLPLYRHWLPAPSPTYLLSHFFGGVQNAGAQPPGPASPAYLILGLIGLIFFGATSLELKVIAFALLFIGAYGVSRLTGKVAKGITGRPARVAAALSYIFLPLYFNDVAFGRFEAIVCYGAMPFVFLKISDLIEKSVYDNKSDGNGKPAFKNVFFSGRSILEYFSFGLLLAVAASFAPIIILLTFITALALLFGMVLFGSYKMGVEIFVKSVLAILACLIILLPWSVTFFQSGLNLSVIFTALPGAAQAPSLADLLRFNLGPIGYGWLGYAMGACALVGLTVAKNRRFVFASRLLVVAIVGWLVAFCFGRGWLGLQGGDLSALLVIPAVSVAAMVGLSLDAILTDLVGHNFGWRQMVTPFFIVAAFIAILPVTIASGSGRWSIPDMGYDTTLSFFTAIPQKNKTPDILWVGNPTVLPLSPWQAGTDLAAGVTAGNLPDITNLWPSTDPGFYKAVLTGLIKVENGETVNYGQVLTNHHIRYVVVLTSVAPVLAGVQKSEIVPMPVGVVTGLANQLDLEQLPSEGGALVFKTKGRLTGAISLPGSTPGFLRILLLVAELLGIWFLFLMIFRKRRGEKRERRHMTVATAAPAMTISSREDKIQGELVASLLSKYRKDTATDTKPDDLKENPEDTTGSVQDETRFSAPDQETTNQETTNQETTDQRDSERHNREQNESDQADLKQAMAQQPDEKSNKSRSVRDDEEALKGPEGKQNTSKVGTNKSRKKAKKPTGSLSVKESTPSDKKPVESDRSTDSNLTPSADTDDISGVNLGE